MIMWYVDPILSKFHVPKPLTAKQTNQEDKREKLLFFFFKIL